MFHIIAYLLYVLFYTYVFYTYCRWIGEASDLGNLISQYAAGLFLDLSMFYPPSPSCPRFFVIPYSSEQITMIYEGFHQIGVPQ